MPTTVSDLLTPETLAQAVRIPIERARIWVNPIVYVAPKFGINTPARLASFIAQCAHESAGFSRLEEDMNYSAHRLMTVWPTRFPSVDLAAQYAHNPVKLGNFVYAGRNGNGNAASGDGYRYRGRGPIQLTGRGNYAVASQAVMHSDRLVLFPEHVAESPYVGVATSAHFWQSNGLNEMADAGAFVEIGNVINTGSARRKAIGTADRIARTEQALEVFA